MPPKRNAARDAEILRLLDLGHTGAEIADRLGCAPATVTAAKKHAGRELSWHLHDWSQYDDYLRERLAEGHTLEWIGAQIGVAAATVTSRAQKLGVSRHVELEHGIPARWIEGCRCEVCKPAMQAYKRRQWERGIARGPVSHGVAGFNSGCRCQVCHSAQLAQLRERQARTIPTATSHGAVWTDKEDEIVLDQTRRMEDIAYELGRTYAAISNRRQALRKRP